MEERPMEERPMEEKAVEEKATEKRQEKELSLKKLITILKKKPIAVRIVGGALTAALLFGSLMLILAAIMYMDFSIDPITHAVSYNYIWMASFLLLAAISLILAVLSFVFLALRRLQKKHVVMFTSIFLAVVLAGFSVWSYLCYDELKDHVSHEINLLPKSPKYTEVSIADFLEDVNRYPDKYKGKTISLEGYVEICYGDDLFILRLNKYENGLYVQYTRNDTSPRVVKGDYVVITGTVDVFLPKGDTGYYDISTDTVDVRVQFGVEYIGTYYAMITGATCEIKEEP